MFKNTCKIQVERPLGGSKRGPCWGKLGSSWPQKGILNHLLTMMGEVDRIYELKCGNSPFFAEGPGETLDFGGGGIARPAPPGGMRAPRGGGLKIKIDQLLVIN